MVYIVYILKSRDKDRFYIGRTQNIENRLCCHNSGKVQSTKAFRPWQIVYSEDFMDKVNAFRREKQIKSYKGGNAFRKLVNNI